jgi:serine protease Do
MPTELSELSNALAQTTDRAAASVVAIHTESRGSSSGVVWRPGVIGTADHALRRDDDIQATLPDGRVVSAVLAGRDPSTDIAVLTCPEITAAAVPTFGDAGTLRPGNLTLVIGRTRASGPVAALGVVGLVASDRRTWTGTSLAPYVRLDVGLQPTAVGGAVIDAHGGAVGMATPRFARFGAIVVPMRAINRIADTLIAKGRMPHGYLGLGLQSLHLPEALRATLRQSATTAAIVLEVEPDGPAHKAGIIIGDILVTLAGHPLTRLTDVQVQLTADAIGKSLPLTFVRGGSVREATIVVGERPNGGR